MLHSFPKIFTLGETYIQDIFQEEVEITEKIDGSQFVFGKINDELYMRSKGASLYVCNPEKMFLIAINYVESIFHLLSNNIVFYCEYLRSPKHNILSYERTPKNNLMLFGVLSDKKFISDHKSLQYYSDLLSIECVPLLYSGIFNYDQMESLIDRVSVLGAQKMEGIVVKNYHRPFLLGGQPIPLMSAKFVTDAFKEKHKTDWKISTNRWEAIKMSYRSEARWLKAIQHLRDTGLLTNSPKDIGGLIKEIWNDITEEEKENIKEFLWKEYGSELLRFSTSGFPEFYKKYIMDVTYKINS